MLYIGWELFPGIVEFARRSRPLSLLVFLSIGLAMGFCAWLLASRTKPAASSSAIFASAYAPNVIYPDGTNLGGLNWKKGWGDLRVTIENSSETTVQNLDVTVQVLDKGIILDMGQMSDMPGVEFHLQDEDQDFSIQLRASDGSTATIRPKDSPPPAGLKSFFFTNHWKVFCPRLLGKTQLRLVLATNADEATRPTKVRVFGTYELMPSEGSKAVKVDTTIAIKR
ncbi:MAG: hypothetical protein ABSE45_01920 [Candidatus Acidiferrales bacterium]